MSETQVSKRNFQASQGNQILGLQSQAKQTNLKAFYTKMDYFR